MRVWDEKAAIEQRQYVRRGNYLSAQLNHFMNSGSELKRVEMVYRERSQNLSKKDLYSFFTPGHLYTIQQRQRAVLQMLRSHGFNPLNNKRILDIGCSDGSVLREFLDFGASSELLTGIDLLRWRMEKARQISLSVVQADGQKLPYFDSTFDLVTQFTVFTSILDPQIRQTLATEMIRVVKPEGMILWYDYWLNPANPDTQGMRISHVRSIFPTCKLSYRRITLAPPLARFFSRYSWVGCHLLESMRIFNTHYLVAIRPCKKTQ